MKLYEEENIHFQWFYESLSKSDKKEFRQMSINNQKDWYIGYLEHQILELHDKISELRSKK